MANLLENTNRKFIHIIIILLLFNFKNYIFFCIYIFKNKLQK
jgi:hypothetical protein